MISSQSTFSIAWTLLNAAALVYILFYMPLAAAFLPRVKPGSALWVVDRLIDVVFIYDIGVNFRTGYFVNPEVDELEVMDFGRISARYLKSWFLLDFVSSMPPVLGLIMDETTASGGRTSSRRSAATGCCSTRTRSSSARRRRRSSPSPRGAWGSSNDDIGNAIADTWGGGGLTFAHPGGQFNVGLLGLVAGFGDGLGDGVGSGSGDGVGDGTTGFGGAGLGDGVGDGTNGLGGAGGLVLGDGTLVGFGEEGEGEKDGTGLGGLAWHFNVAFVKSPFVHENVLSPLASKPASHSTLHVDPLESVLPAA